jgi:hypothetical protein
MNQQDLVLYLHRQGSWLIISTRHLLISLIFLHLLVLACTCLLHNDKNYQINQLDLSRRTIYSLRREIAKFVTSNSNSYYFQNWSFHFDPRDYWDNADSETYRIWDICHSVRLLFLKISIHATRSDSTFPMGIYWTQFASLIMFWYQLRYSLIYILQQVKINVHPPYGQFVDTHTSPSCFSSILLPGSNHLRILPLLLFQAEDCRSKIVNADDLIVWIKVEFDNIRGLFLKMLLMSGQLNFKFASTMRMPIF